MKLQITEIQAVSILTPQKVGSISSGYDFSLNPYAGCAFACSYCYVPKFPNKRHESSNWGKWIEVKINAAELIRKDRHKVFGSRIFFSSATDPYQYIELQYRLTRKCLQELLLYQPKKLTMHTRSHLILQDIELLKKFGHRLQVGVSFPTDNDNIRAEFEPNAPSIKRRLQLIEALSNAGIKVYASISPLLPCSVENLVAMIKPYVKTAWVDQMNWLEVNRSPDLLQKYAEFFDKKNYQQKIIALEKALPSSLN
jgi:DNA repair photolyase